VEILLGHPVALAGLGDGAVTHEHRERHDSIIPQKEPYFLPPIRGFRHEEVKVRINAMPRLDVDDQASQNHRFRI
jgi:hypothetical protein